MMCKDKVALVTGASGGIGQSIALTLTREGAKVAVGYLTRQAAAEAVVGHIKSRQGDAIALKGDLLKSGDVSALVDGVVAKWGRLDICIINPGAGWHTESIDKLDSSAAVEDIDREVSPVYSFLPKILPLMYAQKWGRIIGLGLNMIDPSPSFAYNTAKQARHQALHNAVKSAWKNGEVTINIVAPAHVNKVETLQEAVELCDHGLLWTKRKGLSPQDIAEGVVFLCSDAARYNSGTVLPYFMSTGR